MSADRARLIGARLDGIFKWCAFPCQKVKDGVKISRVCRVAIDPHFSGKVWTVTGPTDAPTLSPSIECLDKPCWHGFIIDGEVRP